MLKRTLFLAAFALGIASLPAKADLVATDWQAAGDAKATLDTQTGIEWLDLQQTLGKSVNTVISQLNTTYAGWRLPTYQEVLTLLGGHFQHDFTSSNYASTAPAGTVFFDHFGHTLYEPTSKTLYATYVDDNNLVKTLQLARSHSTGYTTGSINNTYFNFNSVHPNISTFLVSDGGTTLSSIMDPSINIANPNAPINANPPADVPASAPALLAGLLLLLARRRKTL